MASDWVDFKLSEFVDIKTGFPFKSKHYLEHGEGYKLLRGDNVIQGSFRWANVKLWSKDGLTEKQKSYFLEEGDVILAMDRPWIEAGLKTAQVTDKDLPCLLVQRVARLQAKNSEDQDFLRYLISSYWFVEYLKLVQTGTAIPHISTKQILSYKTKVPPLKERKKIGSLLRSLDDKIELNRQMNETLEAMAQALFKSWFVDFDPVLDNALAAGKPIPEEFIERAEQRKDIEKKDNSDIQSLFPDTFEFTEEMGWIPKGWGVSKVEEEFDVTMGQSPPGSTYNELGEGIYFFQGSTDFGFRYPTPRIYCTAPKRIAKKGDTLVSVRAPVGDTNIAADDCCIGRGLAALRHKSGSASFTYYSMLQLKENFKIYEGEGTVFGSINQKDFKGLLQLKASDSLVSKFEVKAGALDSKIELNSLNIIKLAKLRDTLLPKLMSGELRIPDAEAMTKEV